MLNRRSRLSRRFFMISISIILLLVSMLSLGSKGFKWNSLASIQQQREAVISEREWPKGILELVEVKNLNADDFPKKLGLVVKNVSAKPIYFISISVLFTDSEKILGRLGGMTLYHGDLRLSPAKTISELGDKPINPGDTCNVEFDDERANKFFTYLDPTVRSELIANGLAHLKLVPQHVNFGDGTGYINDQPYPVKFTSFKKKDGGVVNGYIDCQGEGANCFRYNWFTNNGCGGVPPPCLWDSPTERAQDLPCRKQEWISNSCECQTITIGSCPQ